VHNKRLIILTALPFLLVAAAVFGARAVNFEDLVFSPIERRVLNFTPETIEVRAVRATRMAASGAKASARNMASLFGGGRGAGGYSVRTGSMATDPLAMEVSYIMKGGAGRGLAIVNDELVSEGDTVGGMLVKRIEEDKVLLKGKETRWVYMEGLR
jgi:hypothetical protein